jgi:poly-beta-1,6-N-acetyl-D-glucosamine synthase
MDAGWGSRRARLALRAAWEGFVSQVSIPEQWSFRTLPHAITSQSRPRARDAFALTAIVPAFNEAATVADTIRSLQDQTLPPLDILVVDDCSTDETGAVAEAAGARVVRPPTNTGSKAGAQTFALQFVTTGFVMALDADTTLAPDAVERLSGVFSDPQVGAASGSVLPRRVRSVWERGRYVEYLFAFSFFKRIQDHYGKPLISSGCFSLYRTNVVRQGGGWSDRTTAESTGAAFWGSGICAP